MFATSSQVSHGVWWCWRLKLLEKFPGGGTDDWGVSSRNFNSLNLIKTVGDQWDGHWLSWWWWWWWWWDGSVWWKLCVCGVSVSILSSLHTLNTLNTHWLSLVRQLPAPAHTAALQTHTCDTHCSDQSSALCTRRHQPGRAFNRWDHRVIMCVVMMWCVKWWWWCGMYDVSSLLKSLVLTLTGTAVWSIWIILTADNPLLAKFVWVSDQVLIHHHLTTSHCHDGYDRYDSATLTPAPVVGRC